ncbi:hypothetical protein ACP70R_049685 [Stipagrostis hirtigluma subsp. patula]
MTTHRPCERRRRLAATTTRPQTSKKRKQTGGPTAPGVMLPDDLIVEVLLRLPARPLARLRCAGRSWDAEISSRGFQERHRVLAAAAAPKFAFTEAWFPRSRGPGLLPLTCRPCPRVVTPKPCRGVVLIARPCSAAATFSLANPTTGEVLHVPSSRHKFGGPASLVTGIGFDAAAGEYKLVQVSVELESLHARVLTVGDERGWRAAAGNPPANSFGFTQHAGIDVHIQPVFADGCLHWSFKTDRRYIDMPHGIISFSLAGESFRRAPQPPFSTADLVPYNFQEHPPYHAQLLRGCLGKRSGSDEEVAAPAGTALAELDGRLCMMRDVRHRGDVGGLFEVWKLHDYEAGSWSLGYRIELTPGRMADRLTTPWLVVPLRYLDDGGAPGAKRKLLLATTAQEAHVYDPDTATLLTVAAVSAPADLDDSLRLVMYHESLVRFAGMKQAKDKILCNLSDGYKRLDYSQ